MNTNISLRKNAIRLLLKLKIINNEKYNNKLIQKDLNHPERLAVLHYCEKGKGINVGCGNRKTSENCIGIDIIPKGKLGKVGSVRNKISQADITASGDSLHT